MDAKLKHSDITELIIKAFYTVYNTLGYGFLEKVYVNALIIELQKLGLEVGLILNFGPKAQYKRKACDNVNKGTLSWTKQNPDSSK